MCAVIRSYVKNTIVLAVLDICEGSVYTFDEKTLVKDLPIENPISSKLSNANILILEFMRVTGVSGFEIMRTAIESASTITLGELIDNLTDNVIQLEKSFRLNVAHVKIWTGLTDDSVGAFTMEPYEALAIIDYETMSSLKECEGKPITMVGNDYQVRNVVVPELREFNNSFIERFNLHHDIRMTNFKVNVVDIEELTRLTYRSKLMVHDFTSNYSSNYEVAKIHGANLPDILGSRGPHVSSSEIAYTAGYFIRKIQNRYIHSDEIRELTSRLLEDISSLNSGSVANDVYKVIGRINHALHEYIGYSPLKIGIKKYEPPLKLSNKTTGAVYYSNRFKPYKINVSSLAGDFKWDS